MRASAAVPCAMWSNIIHIVAMRNNKDDHNKDNYDKENHGETYNHIYSQNCWDFPI